MGIIYFIQPCELVTTNRYKIGMSSKNDLSRIKSYKSGSRYICIMECVNYLEIERLIIIEFRKKFKQIAGNEYFEGDERVMLELFIETVLKNIKINKSLTPETSSFRSIGMSFLSKLFHR